MSKSAAPTIASLFEIPNRFMRSVQLERDFIDPAALDNYVITPDMAEAFQRIAGGMRANSSQRAWRVTGDYGVGKSSFALVLAHLLSNPGGSSAARIAQGIGWPQDQRPVWPFLVTGSRESLAAALARGLAEGLERRRPGKPSKPWLKLLADIRAVEKSPDGAGLEGLLGQVRALAQAEGAGVLLVVDELGKLLEYAANEPGREDVYLLQKLAERSQGSGETPFYILGLLHQGFHAYAERLPSTTRNEWAKVAERYEEIVFDQPMAHTAALVAGALGVQTAKLTPALHAAADATAKATASMGWMRGGTSAALTLETARIYPLHPTLLPPLVRFFSRFGQNERTLFGFLLSSEPFGLQSFAEKPAGPDVWYGLPEFYDYVRAVFGHRLSGNSYQSQWLRIAATVDTAQDLNVVETRALKSAAILSLLDYPELLATDAALQACLTPCPARNVENAIRTLVDRGLLFRRGKTAGYRLWPNTSVNLLAALEDADRALGPFDAVATQLATFLDHDPVLARRHYIDCGTMRFFEVRYATPERLAETAAHPSRADGLVLVALADTDQARAAAIKVAEGSAFADRDDVVIGITRPLMALAAEVQDVKRWEWISGNTPELRHDPYAAAEVSRQFAGARRALDRALGVAAALRQRDAQTLTWRHLGSPFDAAPGLSSVLSDICDARFRDAPRIANELLNRKVLSSPAAAARMRLIEGLFAAPDQPLFGIDPKKAPPEKSMFLSVIEKGRLQRVEDGQLTLAMPDAEDPLRLLPALTEIETLLAAALGARVGVKSILNRLAEPPFGVRPGVALLLLAIVLKLRSHELAIYEHGTFRATFDGPDFVRVVKAPVSFDLQLCRLEGVRADVFAQLAQAFAKPVERRAPQILDVVQTLSRFVAGLPEYTRKAGVLDARTIRVRDVLLSSTEPATMLFVDLPAACGLEPFSPVDGGDADRAGEFIRRMQAALNELRLDYSRLLNRILDTVAASIGRADDGLDRGQLAQRAALVASTATQPRLKAFANRLRDATLADDLWATALASYLVAKPPARWNAHDEQRCLEELTALSQLFYRVESAAFENGRLTPERDAVLVKLTQAGGLDRAVVVQSTQLSPRSVELQQQVRDLLGNDQGQRLQILASLLWADLPADPAETDTSSEANAEAGAA
ncbi:MAG: hypothetical protein HYU62_09720 [Caulobacterales bacterium]|nr:hypothetical protein [Caulobacterales bacterium]